jgi:tellurite resistance protein TerC
MTSPARRTATASLTAVLLQIGLMDLSLSIDNVIAAVGLAPKDQGGDPVMWPIYIGVLIAILALQAIAPHAMRLLQRYPILEPAAFVLIGYVGVLLLTEEAVQLATGLTIHVSPSVKFAGILLIIVLALLYDADGTVRRIIRPVVRAAMPLMRAITGIVSLVLWPFTRLLTLRSDGRA